MDVELRNTLLSFARENGLGSAEVDKFLSSIEKSATLYDVLKLPETFLNHFEYFPSEIPSSFVMEHWDYYSRYEILNLEFMTYGLDQMLKNVYTDVNFDIYEMTVDEIRLLSTPDDKHKEYLEGIKAFAIAIIELKIGSFAFDW